jgi:hypothetical protein
MENGNGSAPAAKHGGRVSWSNYWGRWVEDYLVPDPDGRLLIASDFLEGEEA